jgi:hypothetical protein
MYIKWLLEGSEPLLVKIEGWFRFFSSEASPLFSFLEEIFKKYFSQILKHEVVHYLYVNIGRIRGLAVW